MCIHAWLEEPGAFDHPVNSVMVVPTHDDGKVKLPARPLILDLVEVAQGQHHVTPVLPLQLVVVLLQALPRVLDFRPSEGVGLVQAFRVAQHSDHAQLASVGAVRTDDFDYGSVHLSLGSGKRLVALHVAVDPNALVLPLSFHYFLVFCN